jgi:hypothetical protein
MCTILGNGSGPAIIAVIGTLGGTIIGGGITYFLQRTQREHKDRVRFHELRLPAYDAFLSAVTRALGAAASWHMTQPKKQSLGDAVDESIGMINTTYMRVRLVGLNPVVSAAQELQAVVGKFTTTPQEGANLDSIMAEAAPLLVAFEAAVRRELGTDQDGS